MKVERLAGVHPDKVALVSADGSSSLSFGELDSRSAALADHLYAAGLRPRDHVAILMGNRAEYLVAAWAAQRSGLFYTPVNWHLTEDEAAYVVSDCGARALLAGDDVAGPAERVLGQATAVETALMAGTARPGFTAIPAAGSGASHEPVEGCYFFYSSGTTGRPKGIVPHHTFPKFGTGLPLDQALPRAFGITGDAVYLCPAPLYHAAPLGWSLGAQRNGATVVLMESFDPETCLQAIERYAVTHVQFVPTMFVRLLKLPEEVRTRYDLSSLRLVVHAGAPCPVEVKRQMIEWLGPVLMEYYAGSEGGGMTRIDSREWLRHPGSVGRPAYGEVHIVGEDGRELPPGEVGTVYFSGTDAFSYHNDPTKTASARNAAGWQTLGDLGHLDEEGYLYLSDRRSDLIISGGVNIYPQEVENALVMHPAVADVAVVGVPDDEMGQSVHAVVQPASGTGDDDLAAVLLAHCRENLAGYKCPRTMSFVAELPRTPAGKLLRRRLRDDLVVKASALGVG